MSNPKFVNHLRREVEYITNTLEENYSMQKQLKRSANQAKGEIHNSISRQLESLRSREIWLLGQVDIIQSSREQLLREQETSLNQALGSLSSTCAGDPGESLNRFYKTDVEEPASISFNADNLSLKEAIHDYGHVEAKRMRLGDVFVEHSSKSRSLPRPYEDYEDQEHHVLYKTLADIEFEKTGSQVINIKIPKLNNVNWLLKPSTAPQVSPPVHDKPQSTSGSDKDYSKWLSKASKPCHNWLLQSTATNQLPRNNSIHQWLCDIKTETSMEDDDFEVVGESCCVSDSCTNNDKQVDTTWEYFDTVRASPMSDWLDKEGPLMCADVLAQQFSKLDMDTSKWLLRDISQDKCEDCPQNNEVVEIEDIGGGACSDDSPWLLRRAVSKVCRANKLCQAFSECVCDDNCCMDLSSDNYVVNKNSTIDSDNTLDNDTSHVTKPQGHVMASRDPVVMSHDVTMSEPECIDKSKWLAQNVYTGTITIPINPFSSYFESLPESISEWLLKENGLSNHETSDKYFFNINSHCDSNSKHRLLRSGDSTNKNGNSKKSEGFSDSSFTGKEKWLNESPNSKWLMKNECKSLLHNNGIWLDNYPRGGIQQNLPTESIFKKWREIQSQHDWLAYYDKGNMEYSEKGFGPFDSWKEHLENIPDKMWLCRTNYNGCSQNKMEVPLDKSDNLRWLLAPNI